MPKDAQRADTAQRQTRCTATKDAEEVAKSLNNYNDGSGGGGGRRFTAETAVSQWRDNFNVTQVTCLANCGLGRRMDYT